MVDRDVGTGFVEALMGDLISPQASPASSAFTLGERFQVKMLAGRSTRHSASTMAAMACGSCAPSIIETVRSSRRAQRAQVPRR